jgi:hypothetical protein
MTATSPGLTGVKDQTTEIPLGHANAEAGLGVLVVVKRLFQNRVRFLAAFLVITLGGLIETRAGQAFCRSEFTRYFEGLGAADARVNPVERLIFSLLLTETQPEPHSARLPELPRKQL